MKGQWLAITIALMITVLCSWCLQSLARRLHFVDLPGGRKHHGEAVPLIGGVAMFLGFTFALLTLPAPLGGYRSFMAALGLLMLGGLLDDFREISPRIKLLFQFGAALIAVFAGKMVIYHLGNLLFFGPILLPTIIAIIFTVIAIIGVINAVNMIDGIDGLAGSVSLSQFVMLYLLALMSHHAVAASLLRLFITISLAFLLFNFPFPMRKRTKIFMGDSGSMFLGFSLVWFCIELSQGRSAIHPVVFLWIMAVPLFDMGACFLYRLIQRQSPFRPGREHLHYVLIDYGISTVMVTLSLFIASLLLGAIALIISCLWHLPDGLLFIAIIILFIGYFLLLHCWLLPGLNKR
ncbi:MAG: undecaprenyl/decaprenyl-phosphate alpha-N-acetylglucosaminyl 1-phosphate transferase [Gammaproteobacteria bacterium]|nr:undecaprenyl/decaprenyl-phosphate alpha-N-acetylglucosaminyl 1-phosphate transferase [Gammaproteobacteria bacterium]